MSIAATREDIRAIQEEILRLKEERNAVILAHNYQLPEVQDVADFVGDSLGLAQKAAETDADVIVFCGVNFMAETAKILNPDKTVLIPDPNAGCSLADSITLEQLREWKKQHPDAVVVCYINTTADVKTECDYIFTSSNAVKVINAIPEDKEILLLPDKYLGMWVKRITGRENIHIWDGACHVHAGLSYDEMKKLKETHPDAELLVHPECGCSSQCLYNASLLDKDNGIEVKILSTSGMIRYASESDKNKFIIATEVGILYPLKKKNPSKEFLPANREAVCEYMKMITIDKLRDSLKEMKYEIVLPREVMERAYLPIKRMLELSN